MLTKSNRSVYLWIGILFMTAIVLLNWSSYIFDSDDAYTLVYHFWGRNPYIQKAYNPYDSMTDFMLSFLPRNYNLLMGAMVLITFLSGIVIFVMLLKLAERFIGPNPENNFYGFIMLLAIPEFVYLTVSYKTSLIGFAFILLGHYYTVRSFEKKNKLTFTTLLISALLFGFGAACRWSLIAYGLAMFVDLAYLQYGKDKWKGIWLPVVWGVLGILFFFLFLDISGYNVQSFLKVVLWSKEYMEVTDYQTIAILGSTIAFFTPIFCISFFVGLLILLKNYKKNSRLILYSVAAILPYFYLKLFPNLKFLITFFPAIFFIFVLGLDYIYAGVSQKYKLVKPVFWILLLLPWFIGIQVFTNKTYWGPGYDIKSSMSQTNGFDTKLDKRFSYNKVKIVPGSGFAITTPEGERPLWGNFYVLFCGQLVRLDKKIDNEVDKLVVKAADSNMTIYTDRVNPLLLAGLCRYNFQTQDPWRMKGDSCVRMFNNDKGQHIIVSRFNKKKDIEDLSKLKEIVKSHKFAVSFTYSSLMADFIKKAPKNNIDLIEQTGAFSGIFEFRQ